MLLVAVLCLGLNWPGMKLGLEIVGPVWMVCLRFLLSLPVLALFVLITKKRLPVLNRKDRSVVFVVAFFQFILSMGLITVSLQFIPAGTASILIYTTPLWMLLIDTLWYRQRPPSKRLILTGISTIGCAMILFASGQPGARSLVCCWHLHCGRSLFEECLFTSGREASLKLSSGSLPSRVSPCLPLH